LFYNPTAGSILHHAVVNLTQQDGLVIFNLTDELVIFYSNAGSN